MIPVTKDLIIYQGKTFTLPVRWETEPIVYKAITGISKASPCRITAPTHAMPDGWRFAVVGVTGMTELNAENSPLKDSDYYIGTVVDTSTIEINALSSELYKAYRSGGAIAYNTPHDLDGYIARMSIRDKVSNTRANLWHASTAYAEDDNVVLADGTILAVSIAGTSGLTEPTGAGVDGTVTWVENTDFSGAVELMYIDSVITSRISVSNVTKTIVITVSATDTADITWKKGVYDLELESPAGVVSLLLTGKVSVSLEVTA